MKLRYKLLYFKYLLRWIRPTLIVEKVWSDKWYFPKASIVKSKDSSGYVPALSNNHIGRLTYRLKLSIVPYRVVK